MGSKIYTIKRILEDDRNNAYPILEIESLNKTKILDKNYYYLIQHSNINSCELYFKKCGILDTYGNIMCLPNSKYCPINEIKVDLKEKNDEYINNVYHSIYLSQLPKDYNLYYTNKSIDKEIIAKLVFSDDIPKYITNENFIFDYITYIKNINKVAMEAFLEEALAQVQELEVEEVEEV